MLLSELLRSESLTAFVVHMPNEMQVASTCLISLLVPPTMDFIHEALASPGRSSTKECLANILPISKVSHFCHLGQGIKRQLAYWDMYLTSTLGYRILSLHTDLGLSTTDETVISKDRQRGEALLGNHGTLPFSFPFFPCFFFFLFLLCHLIKRDDNGLS